LRTFVDKTGEPWFCLKDTCEILNVGNPSDVVKRLQKSRVVSIEVAFKRSVARLNFVNEANFYRVIFQSRKKEATMFQDWVFEEVRFYEIRLFHKSVVLSLTITTRIS